MLEHENELLTEVTAFPYISQISAAKSKVSGTDISDTWTFSNGSQGLGVKAAHLVGGKVRIFRGSKNRPFMFFVFETQGENVKKNIIKIQKPNQSIVTIAKIIASTMKLSMSRTDVVLRIPSKTANIDAVTSISERFIKREGLQHKYKDKIDVKGNYYVVFSIDKQTPVNWEYLLGVKVDNDTVDDASAEKLEMQVKRMMPKKISLVGVAGTDYSDKTYAKQLDDFLAKNPNPLNDAFEENETIDYSVTIHNYDIPLINNRTIDYIKSRFGAGRYAEGAMELIGDFTTRKITVEDVCLMNDRGREAIRLIKNYADGDTDFEGRLLLYIVDAAKQIYIYQHDDAEKPIPSTITTASQKVKDAIYYYTDDTYGDINSALLGEWNIGNSGKSELVSEMDQCFRENGVKINSNMPVYRGMYMKRDLLKQTIEKKLFHFRTYVSTSISIDTAMSFSPQSFIDIPSYESIEQLIGDDKFGESSGVLMSIDNIQNTLSIIPGEYSRFKRELEVILARGTTVRVNNVYGREDKLSKLHVLMNTSVVSPSDIQINETIYDGDYFMLTGELKQLNESELMSFGDFSNLNENKKVKSKKSNDKLIAGELALKLYAKSKMKLSKEERAEQLRLHKKYVLNCG
ncbi:putative ADP-ribosyltransferase [Vibrio phage vB_VmeM-32]|nr:putative ADP-ribosyltransferase [Vibrio phage vB_VmeM-32]